MIRCYYLVLIEDQVTIISPTKKQNYNYFKRIDCLNVFF